ncbi:hypothetical protein HanRHA438_Chr12g0571021 [Helianthus annuus]|nr:hypothetical protein HanHA300_Chr12g0458751 [Helianthus annuus]KAJ0506635.1 hypothetical protein HanHA89_Chr12g0484351 [Helianthus annuus]KAJ0676310.1 hypothetical protein HanLR1_Chr12g0461331 [Helianthus annuus]KAJ0679529.1 hypothetical protein HanOQP8_Chr12g0460631 [Helianthus annuus]KAJ0868119.1 hypothetical protein HanRHA438_Chr12g0571021 [Helianthus annuus]
MFLRSQRIVDYSDRLTDHLEIILINKSPMLLFLIYICLLILMPTVTHNPLYVGPVGRHSCELIEYLEAIDGVSKIKDGCNPATWMLEVSTTAQELALGVDFTEIYKNAELFKRNKAMIAELSVPRPGTKDLFYPTQYSQFPRSVCSVSLETTVVVLA